MNSLLRGFYTLLLIWTQFDIQIARSTGRNPAHILRLRQDEDDYRRALLRLELGI